MKPFLTAEWRDLILINFDVDPKILLPFKPPTVDIDMYNGKAFVSLVAFKFLNTRLRGIKIPYHINFPEINLRFYVNYKGVRGVVFIKEFVPRFFIAKIAKILYNEPYANVPMTYREQKGENISIQYGLQVRNKQYFVGIHGKNAPYTVSENSIEHFFKEHSWGFGRNHFGKPIYYQVTHPIWETYPQNDIVLNFDFGEIYGRRWGFLNDKKPFSTIFAKGSKVKVFPNRDIETFN